MKKKIAIIRPDGNPLNLNSYNSQEVGLAKGLAHHNIDVDVYMSSQSNVEQVEEVECTGSGKVTIYSLPCIVLPFISHAIFPSLIKRLKTSSYNAIQVNEENELTCFWVSRYAAKKQIPLVVFQGMYQPISGRIRNLFQKLYDLTLARKFKRNLSFALAKTTSAKKYLESKGYQSVHVLPVGIDVDKLVAANAPVDYRKKYEIDEDSKILLYIGSIEERRNPDFLLEIAKSLDTSKFILLIAGDGPLKEHISKRISNENIGNVILIGSIPQSQIKALYQTSDVFLLASNYEIYGMVVLEALVFGCPVISTKTAGPKDIIIDGFNGYLVDQLDTSSWTEKIFAALKHINRSRIQYEASHLFSWNLIARQYISIISQESKNE